MYNFCMQDKGLMEEVVALCKRRGFVYQTSSIYGGLANSYDYGPLGAELMRNLRNIWWREFVHKREDIVGLDSQIILHPKVWEASGHVESFFDPLVEDKKTHKRYRADHLIEDWLQKHKDRFSEKEVKVEDMDLDQMAEFIRKHDIKSPEGNELTEPRRFNLLFETFIGVIEGEKNKVYLRGETAQGIFVNFKNILNSTRQKLPFGIAQIGKAFRNEITTGQFIFRTLEFEQAEIEYFFNPKKDSWQKLYDYWMQEVERFFVHQVGISRKSLRWREHQENERAHYSLRTHDLEYLFPFGFKEVFGLAYRTDYDLSRHQKFSGADLTYRDEQTGERFIPHVVEPSFGLNRMFFAVLTEGFAKEKDRIVLKIKPQLAPYKLAVFPLLANKLELVRLARKIFEDVKDSFHTYWDERGNIGKRYRYQDEIGTPFCITVDFQSLEDDTITIRHRDDMRQIRVSVGKIKSFLRENLQK